MPATAEAQLAFEFPSALENCSAQIRYSRSRLCEIAGEIEFIGGNSKSKRIVKDLIFALDAEIEKFVKQHYGFAGGK